MYTGGTTGQPKGVVQLQRGTLAMALRPLWGYGLPPKPRSLAIAPMTHAGYQTPVSTIMAGGTVVVAAAFAPDVFVDTVAKEHITATVGVPSMIYAVMDYSESHDCDFSSLQFWLYAAAAISPDRLAEAQRRWGQIFVQAYAQTESYGCGTALLPDEHDLNRPDRLASCGRAVADTQLRIADDSGDSVKDGEVGEILMRSPYLMDRYLNLPELTEEAFEGGWLHTGDMALMDEDGYVTIVDRKKDMIISGGYNVYSREVEDALMEHADVRTAAVVGVPDDRWGEAVKAFVVLDANVTLDEVALIEYVKARKGGVKAPKSVQFVDELPLTAVGKVDKKALRAADVAKTLGRVVE
jgi:fatty-acyl-CoA synthase